MVLDLLIRPAYRIKQVYIMFLISYQVRSFRSLDRKIKNKACRLRKVQNQ
jgi:hypothetical protein